MEYIDIDSSHRDRYKWPNQADFDVLLPIDTLCDKIKYNRNPVTNQHIIYPNPQKFNQIAFFEENVRDSIGEIVQTYNLPLMYVGDDENTVKLDELVLRSEDPTTTIVQYDGNYPDGVVPLGQANEFYSGDYIEDVLNNEFRQIQFFEYRNTQNVLQTGTVLNISETFSEYFIHTGIITATSIPLSNVDKYYVGKYITFISNGKSFQILDYVPGKYSNKIKIQNPGTTISYGDVFQIIAIREWYATIDRPFTNQLPEYPCFRTPIPIVDVLFTSNILYTTNSTINSIDIDNQIQNGVGILFTESNGSTADSLNIPSDVYAEYLFDISTDIAFDTSNNTFNGTYVGTYGTATLPIYNSEIDGRYNVINLRNTISGVPTNYINLDAHVDDFKYLTQFSISFWLYMTSAGTDTTIMSFSHTGSVNQNYLKIQTFDNTIRVDFNSTSGNYTVTGNKFIDVPNNIWHNVTIVTGVNGGIELYIDGELDVTNASELTVGTLLSLMDSITIGSYNDATGYNDAFGAGYLDDIRFYNRRLTQYEVLSLSSKTYGNTKLVDIKYISTFDNSTNLPVTVFEQAYDTQVSLCMPVVSYLSTFNHQYRPFTVFSSPSESLQNPSTDGPVFISNHLSDDSSGSSWNFWGNTIDEIYIGLNPFSNIDNNLTPFYGPTITSFANNINNSNGGVDTYIYVSYVLYDGNDTPTLYWSYNSGGASWTTIEVLSGTSGNPIYIKNIGIANAWDDPNVVPNRPYIIYQIGSSIISRQAIQLTGSDMSSPPASAIKIITTQAPSSPEYVKQNVLFGEKYNISELTVSSDYFIATYDTIDLTVKVFFYDFLPTSPVTGWIEQEDIWIGSDAQNIIGIYLSQNRDNNGNLNTYAFGWKKNGGLQVSLNTNWENSNQTIRESWGKPVIIDTDIVKDFDVITTNTGELYVIYTKINSNGQSEIINLQLNQTNLNRCRPYRIRKDIPLVSGGLLSGNDSLNIQLPSEFNQTYDIYSGQYIHITNNNVYNIPSNYFTLNQFIEIESYNTTTNVITLKSPIDIDPSIMLPEFPTSVFLLQFENALSLGSRHIWI